MPVAGAQAQADSFDALGYRYEFDLFNPAEHLTLAINDEYGPAATFLGTTKVDRNPPHVTYVYNPTMDFPDVQTAAGHAYWVSELALRDASGHRAAGNDRRALAMASESAIRRRPPRSTGRGVLTGGQSPPFRTRARRKTWGAAPSARRSRTGSTSTRPTSRP